MPSSLSSKKRLRQNEVRRQRNRSVKSNMQTQIRKLREAIDSGEVDASEAQFRVATKKLDQAAAKNVIHPNKAARTKSRLSRAIKALKS